MTVETGEGAWVTPSHWAIWVTAGVRHAIRFSVRADFRTLYIRPRKRPAMPGNCAVIRVGPFLRALILRTIELAILDRREPLHRALYELLLDGIRSEPTAPLDLPRPKSASLIALAEKLQQTAHEGESLPSLAKQVGVGLRTLERKFLAETGLSVGAWRRHARLCNALRELAAGHAVKEAAAAAGYHTASAFVAAFRDVFHTTPGRYFAEPAR